MGLALAGCTFWTGGLAAQKAPPARPGPELLRFGKAGIGPSQLKRAEEIAVDSKGFIYTADWELGRIQRFSPDGKLHSLVYVEPNRLGSLALERSGVLFIIAGTQLFRYDTGTLQPLGEVPSPNGADYLAVASRPGGGVIALLQSRGVDDVAFIDAGGKIERVLRDVVSKVAEYMVQDPALAVDSKGFFFVGDNGNDVIFKFAPDGRFINHFSSDGKSAGQFDTNIESLAIDRHDRLWVADWTGINLFALDGRFLQRFDISAEGIAVEQDELYAVDDTQVVKYAIGQR